MNEHITREGKPSIFNATIGIEKRLLKEIDNIRGRKSKAGKLKEIIEYYLMRKFKNNTSGRSHF